MLIIDYIYNIFGSFDSCFHFLITFNVLFSLFVVLWFKHVVSPNLNKLFASVFRKFAWLEGKPRTNARNCVRWIVDRAHTRNADTRIRIAARPKCHMAFLFFVCFAYFFLSIWHEARGVSLFFLCELWFPSLVECCCDDAEFQISYNIFRYFFFSCLLYTSDAADEL